MLYSDLTKAQRRIIDAFVTMDPSLASADSIPRTRIEELFYGPGGLLEQRGAGGTKIGYPMWLLRGEKVSRGVYKFPCPNPKEHDQEEDEFLAELRANGIKI